MTNLLTKIQEQQREHSPRVNWMGNTREDAIEVSLEWLKGTITLTQIRKAVNKDGGQACYVFIALGLREAFKANKLVINKEGV